jgi:hypothetical protein
MFTLRYIRRGNRAASVRLPAHPYILYYSSRQSHPVFPEVTESFYINRNLFSRISLHLKDEIHDP